MHCSGEGNDNGLQDSCLENSVDRGAWRATVHGVTQSRKRLKRLSTRACIARLQLQSQSHISLLLGGPRHHRQSTDHHSRPNSGI